MSLRDWFKNGWLKEHQTSQDEIQNLFKLVERDLSDCKAENLSLDGVMRLPTMQLYNVVRRTVLQWL